MLTSVCCSFCSNHKDDEHLCSPSNMDTSNNNNNNINTSSSRSNDNESMVANILQNKDLTVELKQVRVKPVVLAPRHPEGNTLYHGREPSRQATNSVIVSVQPRQPAILPPSGRRQSVPRLVEEWFKKMQPPLCSPPHPLPPSTPSPVFFDALNLSVKVSKEDPKPVPKESESGSTGKSSQIFLRPITAIQDPSMLMSRVESPVQLQPHLSPPR